MKRALLLITLIVVALTPAHAGNALPRVLVALYNDQEDITPRTTHIHRFLEMPANHLGYDIQYFPLSAPLPALGDEVAGVVIWFNNGSEVPDANTYLDWLDQVADSGKKLLVIENGGIGHKLRQNAGVTDRWNHILQYIGLYDEDSWEPLTYRAKLAYRDKHMVGFERDIGPVLPAFIGLHLVPKQAVSHLTVALKKVEGEIQYDLVVTSANGGYIAEDYAMFQVVDGDEAKISQWIVNPFTFLKTALATPVSPVPDVTTLSGLRIFYSHIDGDGWNNISEITRYNASKTIAAEVIRREILQPYSDFAFNVGLITADVDAECYAAPDSERVARDIYALGNVEPSSHTHSHPLFWRFFAQYTPEKEKPFLSHYPSPPRHDLFSTIKQKLAFQSAWAADAASDIASADHPMPPEATNLVNRYETPRSYACKPFDLEQEISGSVARVAELAPGKKVALIQWSGDTSPFAGALAEAAKAGVYNINGGDSRFDSEYPSYSYVAPVGLKIGEQRQVYSSNSNENTYTNLWTGRFFGFRYLQTTVENTEHPIRVKPFNLYFHMYSGEKDASLNAIKENLEYARKQELIPVTTSEYAAIANGFYSTRIVQEGDMRWRIVNRGALQTVRLDSGESFRVDMEQSSGVLGYRYHQGSLYVALDARHDQPLVALKAADDATQATYLIDSSWRIEGLQSKGDAGLTFAARGYGAGKMQWQMPRGGTYTVTAVNQKGETTFTESAKTGKDAVLTFNIKPVSNGELLFVTIARDTSHV